MAQGAGSVQTPAASLWTSRSFRGTRDGGEWSGHGDAEESSRGPFGLEGKAGLCLTHPEHLHVVGQRAGDRGGLSFPQARGRGQGRHGRPTPLASSPVALRCSSLQARPPTGREDESPGGLPAAPVAAAPRVAVATLPKQRL